MLPERPDAPARSGRGVGHRLGGDHLSVVVLAMSTLGTVLLVWAAVLALLVAALALSTRRRRPGETEVPERRGSQADRRRGDPDRRIGLPDLRTEKVERRSARGDRRGGVPDRRRSLGAIS
jgi:hypothetical protein